MRAPLLPRRLFLLARFWRAMARMLRALVVLCAACAQQARAAAQQQRNTFTVPAGAVPALTTAWTTRAAAAVRALAPRALDTLSSRLRARGINVRTTERIIISPALRVFVGSVSTPLPLTLAELGAWVRAPAVAVSRVTFFPLQVLFRTQYYLATDYLAGIAPPNTEVPIPAGVGQRGLRRLLGIAAANDEDAATVAVLKDRMLARVIAEAASCISEFELAAPEPRRRLQQAAGNTSSSAAWGNATATAADPLAPLDAWDAEAVAMLLAHLQGFEADAAGARAAFGSLLALALQAQASVFQAQFVDTRVGVAATVLSIPAADLSLFVRKGVEVDSFGADTFVRLVAPTATPQPPPPPPPPPDVHSGAAAQSLLALSLPAGAALPRNTSLLAQSFVAMLQTQAGALGAVLDPLAAELRTERPLINSLNVLITPIVSLILGQLTYNLPTTAAGLAAALQEPTLAPLLNTTIDVTAAVILVINVVFIASPPPLVVPLAPPRTLAGRRLLSGAGALTPNAMLAAFSAFLGSAGACVRVVQLLASFQSITFDSISFQQYTGAAAREVLRASATVNKTAHDIVIDKSLLVAPSLFSIFQVTVSANTGVTASLKRKPPPER